MPLKKDPQGGGSEADGSRSGMYCSSCYADGKFLHPDLTLPEMQSLIDDILKNEMKWPLVLRWMAKRQLPSLVRWRKK